MMWFDIKTHRPLYIIHYLDLKCGLGLMVINQTVSIYGLQSSNTD